MLRMINAKNRNSSYLFRTVCMLFRIFLLDGVGFSPVNMIFFCLFVVCILQLKSFCTLQTELADFRDYERGGCGIFADSGMGGIWGGEGRDVSHFPLLFFTIAKIKKPFATARRFLILGFIYLTRVFTLTSVFTQLF